MALGILIFAICLGAMGQIFLKAGVSQLGAHPAPLLVLRSIVTNLRVFGGFACYGLSSLFYLVAISRLDLSYAYPMIALSYVMVTFLSWKYLNEAVPALRIVGLAIIMAGVVVMALSYHHGSAGASDSGQVVVTQASTPPGSE